VDTQNIAGQAGQSKVNKRETKLWELKHLFVESGVNALLSESIKRLLPVLWSVICPLKEISISFPRFFTSRVICSYIFLINRNTRIIHREPDSLVANTNF